MDYITTSNLYWNRFELEVIKQMPFTDKDLERCVVTKGDLLVCEGGDIGRAAIWSYDYDICIQNHIHRLRGKLQLCNLFYYYVFYEYKLINRISSKGTTIQGLSSKEIDTLLIPLPPLAEQKRIVAEIEKWFVLIDELDANKQDLQGAIKQVRAKVLDLAIHGKLVPQDPDDEPAIALLCRINPHFTPSDTSHYQNVPFNIPASWEWVRLDDVAVSKLGKTLDSGRNKGNPYDYLCAINVKWGSFDLTTLKQILLEDEEKERYLVRKGDLLICEGGDVGRSAIWESNKEMYYQNAIHRVHFYGEISQYYFLYLLEHYKNVGIIDDVSKGVTIKHFTQNAMQKILFPLPPLAEQKRIVSEIERIFGVLGTIEENIR